MKPTAIRSLNISPSEEGSDDDTLDDKGKIEHTQLNNDLYSSFVLTMVTVTDEINSGDGEENPEGEGGHLAAWVCTSVTLFCINILLQLGLSFYLFTTFIESKEDLYEKGRSERLANELIVAMKNGTALSDDDEAVKLCNMQEVPTVMVYFIAVFIWCTRMTQEIAASVWNMQMLSSARTHGTSSKTDADGDDSTGPERMLVATGMHDKKRYVIKSLSHRIKLLAVGVITIPRLLISFWVTYVGAKLLILSVDVGSIILKVLAASIFVNLDEQLFSTFVSHRKKRFVSQTSLEYVSFTNANWNNYVSTWLRLAGVAVLSSFFVWGALGNVASFRYTCNNYKRVFSLEMIY